MKRSPIRPRRATPRRRDAPRGDAAWWHQANLALLFRSGGFCEHCGERLYEPIERHHRLKRRDGGDRLSNLLYVHQRCHQWITEHPHESVPAGRIVRTGHDPADVPVWIAGDWWLLHDDGTKTRTENP